MIYHRWVIMCFHTDLQQRVPISMTQQALSFSIFPPPLFIVSNCCLSFALLYQTQILYRKKLFHLIHFFQEIFHIMYLNSLGANNGEQDCISAGQHSGWHFILLHQANLKQSVVDWAQQRVCLSTKGIQLRKILDRLLQNKVLPSATKPFGQSLHPLC